MSVHVKNLPSRYGVCTSIEQKASYERWNASLPLSWLFLCTLKDNECAKCADSFRGNQNQELFHLIIPVSLNLACVATKNLTCYFDKPDQVCLRRQYWTLCKENDCKGARRGDRYRVHRLSHEHAPSFAHIRNEAISMGMSIWTTSKCVYKVFNCPQISYHQYLGVGIYPS